MMSHSREVFTAAPEGMRRRLLLDLAASGPVHRVTLPSGAGAWLVTGHTEARAALIDRRLVRGTGGGAYVEELPELAAATRQHMLLQNPPGHTRLRKLVAAAFTRRRVEQLEPTVEKISAHLIDMTLTSLHAGETVDIVTGYAYPFSFRVLCVLLGIPAADEKALGQLFATVTQGAAAPVNKYGRAGTTLVDYVRGLIAEKRRQPGDDLVSSLVAAQDGDDRLSPDELTSMVFLLMVAGHETTESMIANGLLLLLHHPEQLGVLRTDPERLTGAVEEILRYDGPVQSTFPAVAVENFQLGGQAILVGDVVVVSPLAASLDTSNSGQSVGFDVHREVPAHLAFGHGIHHCLGAPLARMEGRIAFRDLIGSLPDLELTDDQNLSRSPSVLFNGIAALRVRLAGQKTWV
ncbi:cytochrome P450 [Actinoplanes sp. NPDC051343]|uniref:cytochrome P450 n=1 Tax=Actinoplanes sp. NPDC051343 TaxID=3363906 RepID=UPI0037BD62B8